MLKQLALYGAIGVAVIGAVVFAFSTELIGMPDQPANMFIASSDSPKTMKWATMRALHDAYPRCKAQARVAAGLRPDEGDPHSVRTVEDWVKAGSPDAQAMEAYRRWERMEESQLECMLRGVEAVMCDPYARWWVGEEIASYVRKIRHNEGGRYPKGAKVTAAMIVEAIPVSLKTVLRTFHTKGLLIEDDVVSDDSNTPIRAVFRALTAGQTITSPGCKRT